MEFAGNFTFVADRPEEDMEEMSVDLAGPEPASPASNSSFQLPKPPSLMRRKVRKANTNVLAVDLSTLSSDAELKAGDPFFCSSCEAVFSTCSKVEANGVWVCEFCNTENKSMLEDEEIPKSEMCDWILEPAPKHSASTQSQELIIFAIDISGSMCSTQEVPGSFKLRGAHKSEPVLQAGDDRHQRLPGHNRDITYVSRLQCVQAAIESQLEQLYQQKPNALVGLVVFNRDVTIIGDGTSQQTVISGDKLENFDQLLAFGEANKITRSIKDSRNKLVDVLFKLEEDGPTALGPAVVACLGLAKGCPGAKIVLCTDGLSNTGIGAMDTGDMTDAINFYERAATFARLQSSTINIVSIKGGDSVNLGLLGKMADETQGDVNIVDPLKITSEFAAMLQGQIVATNVVVKLRLHKGLNLVNIDASKLLGEDKANEKMEVDQKEESGVKNIGNAYDDSEITFEYEVRDKEKLDELFEARAKLLGAGSVQERTLPFQVQITYTKLDGSKCIRTITKEQKITHDRQQAEVGIKAAILGTHAWGQSAKLASEGQYEAAMLNNMQTENLFGRAVKNKKQAEQYASGTAEFNFRMKTTISRQQQQQQQQAPQQQQAYGSAPSSPQLMAPSFRSAAPQQQQQMLANDDDESAATVYRFKSTRKQKKMIDRD